eukprot:scaffold321657_cov24-Tisochrysis_lutea.AAC.1
MTLAAGADAAYEFAMSCPTRAWVPTTGSSLRCPTIRTAAGATLPPKPTGGAPELGHLDKVGRPWAGAKEAIGRAWLSKGSERARRLSRGGSRGSTTCLWRADNEWGRRTPGAVRALQRKKVLPQFSARLSEWISLALLVRAPMNERACGVPKPPLVCLPLHLPHSLPQSLSLSVCLFELRLKPCHKGIGISKGLIRAEQCDGERRDGGGKLVGTES